MKSVFALMTGLLISVSTFAAVRDGVYTCTAKDNKTQVTFKIGTMSASGLSVTVMEITTVTTDETGTKTYVAKGIANQFVNDKGEEFLSLGNHLVDLVAGRPSCAQ